MFSIFTGAYSGIIKIILILSLVGSLYGTYRYKVNQEVNAALTTERVEQQEKLAAEKEVLILKKKSTEKSLAEDFSKRQGENDAKIKSLNNTVDSLLNSLQSRPTREVSTADSARDSSAGQSGAGSTGAGLYRADAEFLVGLAANTETLKLGLIQCYKDYDSVKKNLESYSKQ